jgi:hypothetical protein
MNNWLWLWVPVTVFEPVITSLELHPYYQVDVCKISQPLWQLGSKKKNWHVFELGGYMYRYVNDLNRMKVRYGYGNVKERWNDVMR